VSPRRSRAGGARKRPARYTDVAPGPHLGAALRAHRKGSLREATEAYRAAIAAGDGALDAWVNLGAVCVQRGLVADARAAFAEATARAKDNARAQRDIGVGLATLGDFGMARAAFGAALALDPSRVGARIAWSRVCGEDGDGAEARHHAEAATRAAPEDPSAWLELHRARFDDARPDASIEAAARAVALDPSHGDARVLLSGALALRGDHRAAEAALGDEASVPPGLRDALHWCSEHPQARAFAYKREALAHAAAMAPTRGATLEFGVRFGVSTRVLAALTSGVVHGFDSFAGLPEPWGSVPRGAFSMEGVAPALPPNVALHVGLFDDTLPPFVAALAEPPRLVHVDSDLYASARAALTALGPRVTPGCVLLFDEYVGNARWREDEHRAFTEAAEAFRWRCEVLSRSWVTGQVALRVLSVDGRGPPG